MLACEDSAGRLPALFVSSAGASWTHFTSGFDGENGFYTSANGIVVLLPSGAQLEFSPGLEMRGISRSEWIRAARASAFPHSKQYPRIALLDPSAFEGSLTGAAPAGSVRSLCIPSQRLQAGSGLAIYGRRPAWIGKGFSGYCEIVLPSWTLQHFRALGVTLDGLKIKDGTRSKAARLAYHIHHHTLKLLHATTQTTVVVTVFTCPAQIRGPLHVSVGWVGPSCPVAEETFEGRCQEPPHVADAIPTECDGHHINAWEDGKKCHQGPAGHVPAVTLQFSIWDADDLSGVGLGSDVCGYYALDISLEFPDVASGGSRSSSPSGQSWSMSSTSPSTLTSAT
ncbi:uncharacterized protein TRAVEDRAFT_47335 [Trametes versicolor FP-101664 SS1]|uniref:uncharacterized protein n=1 Tax=Trametes versicolor (strain FP-101664) TaxID=717944 RepID=UPI0004623EB7|nr:uncharacterized protein TRAVEDRAFT_47335 [Trametes versicolor FP-101664 SS1]EIW58161.1 hypothetical protein TRAVEDRAFT_47335 [Trametes versicolor FP-101664 SS1]